jgi:Tfp pilus assembly protein PilO
LEGSKVLEWKPRLIMLILVVVLVGLVAGWFGDFTDSVPMNWEW